MSKIHINLLKRKEKMYDFYYMVFGQIIKKRRLELKYTQEFVAKAICSDTYVSKAENNKVIIGDQQLYRIMEKLDIPRDEYGNPEELIYYLGVIIKYYYYEDFKNYKNLVNKVENYQFHVVIEIIKLGYYIMINDYQKSIKISDQLLDYLSSMDDLAFSVFLIMGAILNTKMNRITHATHYINAIFMLHLDYKELINLNLFANYIVYGKSFLLVRAEETYNELVPKLMNTYNQKMLKEVMVWKAIFKEYENDGGDIEYLEDFIKDVDENLVDEFLLLRAINKSEPEKYVKYMKNKKSEKYLIGLYLCSKQALKNKDKELYNKYQKELKDLHYKIGSKVDYNNLLKLEKSDNLSFYKDYLVNTCLKVAKEDENIFFMTKISNKVVDILKSRNRYKDALSYQDKLEEEIELIKSGKII